MIRLLFEAANRDDWMVLEFFNLVYSQGRFFQALQAIGRRDGIVVNDAFWSFDEDDVNGSALVGYGDYEMRVPEGDRIPYLKKAAEAYLALHPGEREKLESFMCRVA